MSLLKKIVVIGPESTGKSTLCGLLSKHYQTVWCPEYAREYLLANGTKYSYEDLLTIAKGQLDLEGKYSLKISREATPAKYFFIDTDMYVMKVWCEFVFGKCHQFILNEINKRKYDLYLLCDIDLPWVSDSLREYPEEGPRKQLYSIYKNILENQHTPWVNISGTYNERLANAIDAINTHL